MLYVSRVELENFRCFERVTVEADVSAERGSWTLLTGDNASGKSTLLKAIAIGLCDQSSAAGLLRESDSGYIRYGKKRATITIHLVDPVEGNPSDEIWIKTTLTSHKSSSEQLQQETKPKNFPWEQIFVCGYGAGRGTSGTGDVGGYMAISAVYNLFNYSEGLQNPELAIRRLGSPEQERALETLKNILKLDDVRLAESGKSDMGISVRDPRNVEVALRDLADGYKSTFLWVTDFLGWATSFGSKLDKSTTGIVIIDEIEQHLHPKWQKRVISDLREAWPQVQFFAATHSPLVARSFQPYPSDGPQRHYHLWDSEEKTEVEAVRVQPLGDKRTDQVLATEAFDFLIDNDPEVDRILEELTFLGSNEFVTDERKALIEEYLEAVREIESIRRGGTKTEVSAARLIELTQRSLIEDLQG